MNSQDIESQTHAAWALRASAWPLGFAQVREDPRLDVEVLRRMKKPASAVMIASGGETVVCVGRTPLKHLTVVDMNAAQLALTRLKWHLAQSHTPEECMALLGQVEMDAGKRKARLAELLPKLGLSASVFGPLDEVAGLGPDRAGRYELLFAELQRVLSPHAETITRILHTHDPCEATLLAGSGTVFGEALDAALAHVMSQANLECLFGHDATRNPRQPFHRHFALRIRHSLATMPAATNPFLWQLLEGRFAPAVGYDWLDGTAAPIGTADFKFGRMHEVLAAMGPESVELVHLSNILDWLSTEDAMVCLCNAARVLRSGGCVIVRQLNSTLNIPSIPCELQWDEAWGRELHARDRSFFYTAIHIGRKP